MLGRGRADSRQPLSARSPLFCSRPPRHTQRNQPCGLGSRCGPSTWGALGWNTELVGCRVGLSEERACSRRLWGQRGSPAGVYGLSLRGAHGADLALECPMAQWPDQGQRCLDPRGVGGGGSVCSPAACCALAHPVPPCPSQQPGHCPERSVLMALLPTEPRSPIQSGPGLWCSTQNSCRSPAGLRAPRCYLLVEAAAGDLAPHCRPTRGPFRVPPS